jgi:soluble cytochrome b562
MSDKKPVGKTTIRTKLADYCKILVKRASEAKPKKRGKSNTEKARKATRGLIMTAKQIEEAQKLAARGWTNKRISARYNVGIGQVNRHCRGIKRGYKDGR